MDAAMKSSLALVTIVNGWPRMTRSGVSVRVIVERFYVGERLKEIATDYDMTRSEVEAALRVGTRFRSSRDIEKLAVGSGPTGPDA